MVIKKDHKENVCSMLKKDNVRKYKFDEKNHGWRGPITGEQNTLRITKQIQLSKHQLRDQDPLRLHHYKRGGGTSGAGVVSSKPQQHHYYHHNEDDGTSQKSVYLTADAYPITIREPFNSELSLQKNAATWKSLPVHDLVHVEDKWNKTVLSETDIINTPLENELSPSSQLRKSEKLLKHKDQQLLLMQKSLMEAHVTNNNLISIIDSCSGKDMNAIEQQNYHLKAYVSRLSKSNSVLQGHKRKNLNPKVLQLVSYPAGKLSTEWVN